MSRRALQRTIVRMLFDPAFAERVLSNERIAELSEEEHRWLREPDARAWRTDPHRRARALQALLEEFPASAALTGDARDLIAFFSSDAFHACIREGESLALTFGAWLAKRLGPPASDVARIETAIAQVRRGRPREETPGVFSLPSTAEIVEVDTAASQLHANTLRRLGPTPLETLARGPVTDLARVEPW